MKLRPRKRSFWKRVSIFIRSCLSFSLGATVLTICGITRSSVQAQSVDTINNSSNTSTKSNGESFEPPTIKYNRNEGFIMGVIDGDPPPFWEVDIIERSFYDNLKSLLHIDKESIKRNSTNSSEEIKKESSEKKQN